MEVRIRQITPAVPILPIRKRVAAYARVSSEKISMVESLSAQVSYYSAYIQRNPEWEYAGVYADEGFTGTKNNRPEFQRLLADCRAGRIDIVLTKSVSRFARNTLTLLGITRELKELGIDVFFEKENMHSTSGDGELMLSILASFAQEESRSVSENCKWRIRKRYAEGDIGSWGHLFGYRISHGQVEIDPERAEIVRKLFSDFLDGKTATALASGLRRQGVCGEQGGMLKYARIVEMLRNEKYTGNQLLQKTYTTDHLTKKICPNNGELPQYYVEGTHPAIIDLATYSAVQQELDRRESLGKGALWERTHDSPFRLKIECPNCGHHYSRRVIHGYASWACSSYVQYGKNVCACKRIPEMTLMEVTASVLEIPHFDETVFNERIDRIIATAHNVLTFVFIDGKTVERTWQDRSRRESWTDEMREAARQKMKERWNR